MSKSKYRGVRYKKGGWEVRVYDPIAKKKIYICRVKTELEAASLYNYAASEILKDKAIFNQIEGEDWERKK